MANKQEDIIEIENKKYEQILKNSKKINSLCEEYDVKKMCKFNKKLNEEMDMMEGNVVNFVNKKRGKNEK